MRREGTRRPSPGPALAAVAGLFAAAVPGVARAADCDTLPSPVYGIGGSAHKPYIAKVATALAKLQQPITVVYQAPGACNGINALLNNTRLTGTASYWDTAGKEQQCTLPLAGIAANFANMGNYATSCPGVKALPATIGDFKGAATAIDFVVPTASTQQSISAEAAYFVYGFGQSGRAAPWTDETQIIKRDQNSFATLFVSLATGVPPASFKGVDAKTNAGTVMLVGTATKPEAAIGFASSDVADANRATVRVLAYQHTGQGCGYWPDSSPTAFDKINVRTGQYWLWGQTHFYAFVDANGKIKDANTATFVGLFTGDVTLQGVDMLALTIQSGNVPLCAMYVTRAGDLGPLASWQAPEPCDCAFEKIANGSTKCTACTANKDCPQGAPVCRYGYCEVK